MRTGSWAFCSTDGDNGGFRDETITPLAGLSLALSSHSDISAALPPEAVVSVEHTRSVAKRCR